jgi:hypothetical protein
MAADPEADLVEDIAGFTHDPLGFALYAFPWGDGELSESKGPRQWQRDLFEEIGAHLRNPETRHQPLLISRASGHGIGKSAAISMLVDWAMSTCEDCKVVITANTENQLRTKTWPEVSKWFRLGINAHWFNVTATAVAVKDKEHERGWRADAVPWSENNTEAFAGLHNKGKRIVLIFDEASNIADKVWEVAEGALTDEDTEIIWLAFGNPTRNTGRFRETFGRLKHRWKGRQIDSRTVEGTNKAQIAKWVADYGEDSDFVKVRVRGMFPSASSTQLIPSDLVTAAREREATATIYDPIIMAVDVARFGDDQSVIRFRRGRDARTIPAQKFRGIDTMQLAGRVAALIDQHKPDAVFIDETGVGGGVVDRLRQLGHTVVGVNFGAKADAWVEGERPANKRAEMWMRGREWLRSGGVIDDDDELAADLEGVEYGYDTHNSVLLEKKDDMKKRGLSSPDDGDALMLTFAYPVAKREDGVGRHASSRIQHDYDPFA